MNLPEKIKTIDSFNEFILKEKKSEFIGQIFLTESEEDAQKILSSVKKKYYDASHHCYAYKLLDGKIKYSDDREPKGTAGIRILNAIEHFELVNQLVVVIRYFGGTKLGVGPLGKAYYDCSFNLLKTSKIIIKNLYQKVIIKTDYEHLSSVNRKLRSLKLKIEDSSFNDQTTIECLVKPGIFDKLKTEIAELTQGRAELFANKQFMYR
jgi:uncharacterized YigZ family protein